MPKLHRVVQPSPVVLRQTVNLAAFASVNLLFSPILTDVRIDIDGYTFTKQSIRELIEVFQEIEKELK